MAKMIACPVPLPTVREVCSGGMFVCRAFFVFGLALIRTAPRAIFGLSPYLTAAEAKNLRELTGVLLFCGLAGFVWGSFGQLLPPCRARRGCASVVLFVTAMSVCMFGDVLVLACAAWGARLGHEATVAAYEITGAVVGAGALLGFMVIVWGKDDRSQATDSGKEACV